MPSSRKKEAQVNTSRQSYSMSDLEDLNVMTDKYEGGMYEGNTVSREKEADFTSNVT